MLAAVTGANGFIGSNLVNELSRRGWDVRALVRRGATPAVPTESSARGVSWLRVDYSDHETLNDALAGADVVFHLAGATRAPSVAALRRSHVGPTTSLVQAASRAGVRLVHVSSQAAAGPAAGRDDPVTENTEPAPVEAYGRAKLETEGIAAGAPRYTIVRPAAVYGPGDRDFLQMFRLAERGLAIHPGNRDHWISVVHVDDLVNALIVVATFEPAAGKTYFVANESPVRWRDLFALASEAAGRRLRADVQIPASIVNCAALAGDLAARITGRATLLGSQKAKLGKQKYWVASPRLIHEELGVSSGVELASGMRETYRWYKEHAWL